MGFLTSDLRGGRSPDPTSNIRWGALGGRGRFPTSDFRFPTPAGRSPDRTADSGWGALGGGGGRLPTSDPQLPWEEVPGPEYRLRMGSSVRVVGGVDFQPPTPSSRGGRSPDSSTDSGWGALGSAGVDFRLPFPSSRGGRSPDSSTDSGWGSSVRVGDGVGFQLPISDFGLSRGEVPGSEYRLRMGSSAEGGCRLPTSDPQLPWGEVPGSEYRLRMGSSVRVGGGVDLRNFPPDTRSGELAGSIFAPWTIKVHPTPGKSPPGTQMRRPLGRKVAHVGLAGPLRGARWAQNLLPERPSGGRWTQILLFEALRKLRKGARGNFFAPNRVARVNQDKF